MESVLLFFKLPIIKIINKITTPPHIPTYFNLKKAWFLN